MSAKEIQYLMQNLSDVHKKFIAKDYDLSSLDVHTVKNLIERLHLKLLTQVDEKIQPVQSRVIPQPVQEIEQVPIVNSNSATVNPSIPKVVQSENVQTVNDEIDDVFFQREPVETVVPTNIQRDSFQLGINEKIMFAKELFDDDVSSLQESIRKLKSFESKDEAINFFKEKFTPFLIDEGKDEEIISEFEQIIHRIY